MFFPSGYLSVLMCLNLENDHLNKKCELTKRDELSFFTVLALPKDSRMGLACRSWRSNSPCGERKWGKKPTSCQTCALCNWIFSCYRYFLYLPKYPQIGKAKSNLLKEQREKMQPSQYAKPVFQTTSSLLWLCWLYFSQLQYNVKFLWGTRKVFRGPRQSNGFRELVKRQRHYREGVLPHIPKWVISLGWWMRCFLRPSHSSRCYNITCNVCPKSLPTLW